MNSSLSKFFSRIIPIVALALLIVLYFFTNSRLPKGSSIIIDDDIPLASLADAYFYVIHEGVSFEDLAAISEDMFDYVGEGTVLYSADIYNNSFAAQSAIATAPDLSAINADGKDVEWSYIIKLDQFVVVAGTYTDYVPSPVDADFYLYNPEHDTFFTNVIPDMAEFIGNGQILYSEDVYNKVDSVWSQVTEEPEYSAPDGYYIEWESAYKYHNKYVVVGRYVEGEKPSILDKSNELYADSDSMMSDDTTLDSADQPIPQEEVAVDIIPNLFANVEELKAANLESGEIVTTKGYYYDGDGGASEYLISANEDKNSLQNIQLNNGLYAVLQVNDVLNVKQLGAVGDGISDDTDILKKALKAKIPTVDFAPGTYLCTKHLIINTTNLTINGNNSTIISDNNFNASYREWFITFSGSNITVNNLQFKSNETIKPKFKTQVGIRDITNFNMYGCKFIIPDTVISDTKDAPIEYSNLDIYCNWHYVTIDHCTFDNYSGDYAGVNAEIRDIKMSGCDHAVFTNNICHHNTRDEIFSLFTLGDKNTITDVTIMHNQFYELPCPKYTRFIGMSLGYDSYGRGATNVTFTDNYFEGYSDYNFLKLAYSENILVERNEFVCHIEDGSSTLILVQGCPEDTNAHVQNNSFVINNDGFKKLKSVASGKVTLSNNNITTYLKFNNTLFEKHAVDNNNIITNAN